MKLKKQKVLLGVLMLTPIVAGIQNASAVPVDGGTLDPTTIPKYVTPLVIPPVMRATGTEPDPEFGGTRDVYDIAVRQFKQQILPGGIWNTLNGRTDAFPATTIWQQPRVRSGVRSNRLGISWAVYRSPEPWTRSTKAAEDR